MLGIRPLQDCDDSFLKNLEKERVYPLYNDYTFFFEDDDPKKNVTAVAALNEGVPENFYGFDDLKINVSAVVGKNGSGKSSLMELFFWSINNIATNFIYDASKPKEFTTKSITANLSYVEGIFCEFYFCVPSQPVSEQGGDSQLDQDLKKDEDLKKSQDLDFYKVRVGKAVDGNFKAFKQTDGSFVPCGEGDFNLSTLFYNEVVNYSHYAYNSVELGAWLDGLFHKNDSYQTPLVLNPMRTRGNFDINTENDLLRQRLLANLLRPSVEGNADFRKFGDNLEAHHLKIGLKKEKTYVEYELEHKRKMREKIDLKIFDMMGLEDAVPEFLLRMYTGDKRIKLDKNRPHFNEIRSYILYKVISISEKYTEYGGHFKYFQDVQVFYEVREKDPGKISSDERKFIDNLMRTFPYRFLKDLVRDNSHITFKLKQSLNYLLNDSIDYSLEEPVSIEGLSQKIEGLGSARKLIEVMVPPIFSYDVLLRSIKGNREKDIELSRLSSGEKQLIYTVSSILYHLFNLDSVSNNKIQYRYINLVLEEIELYFHPEYQKQYVSFLRKSIGRIGLEMIKSVNIILVTHSPFILSDIPKNNILYLDVDDDTGFSTRQDPQKMKSFGANITDLLADSFFIKNGLIGDFARQRINEALQWLRAEAKKKAEAEGLFPEADAELPVFNSRSEEKNYYSSLIDLIDEPLVRQKLRSMYIEFVKDDPKSIQLEIERLRGEIEKLEKLENKDA